MRRRAAASTIVVMRYPLVVVAALAAVALAGCGGEPAPESPATAPTTASVATPSTSTPAPAASTAPVAPSATSTAAPTAVPSQTPKPSSPPSTTPGVAPTTPSITGRVVSRLPTTRKVVALTFDGGSGSEGAESVIATLTREQVPATFFLTGTFADKYPSLSIRVARLGLVGNHTASHPHLPQLSDANVRSQVISAHDSILRVTAKDPHPLFRFPYGDDDTRTLRLVNGLGYVAVGWTVDTLGWKGRAAGISVAQVAARTAAARAPGEIVLMHLGAAPDGSTLDADALSQVIHEARSAGYGFVTLSQL